MGMNKKEACFIFSFQITPAGQSKEPNSKFQKRGLCMLMFRGTERNLMEYYFNSTAMKCIRNSTYPTNCVPSLLNSKSLRLDIAFHLLYFSAMPLI